MKINLLSATRALALTVLATVLSLNSHAALIHRWTFDDGTANDSIGTAHGTNFNGATISGGQLNLDGVNDYFRTSPLAETISNRTLVVWLTLSNLTQQGGSALTIENPTGADVFDGIVYGEAVTNRWINGSDGAARWQANPGIIASQIETSTNQVCIAIVYGDGPANGIKIYRNGALYADYGTAAARVTYPAGISDVVIGVRHTDAIPSVGTATGSDPYLAGSVNEARIYDTALTSNQIPLLLTAPFRMATGNFYETFDTINTWVDYFSFPAEASRWSSVSTNFSGTIPDGQRVMSATTSFGLGLASGVYKDFTGSSKIALLSTGVGDNTNSVAIDLMLDFTGRSPGILNFDWVSLTNNTGDRASSLRVYTSTNGTTFTELAGTAVLNLSNNVVASGSITNIQLPATFSNCPTARIRFYQYNGTGGSTGSRAKIGIDNVAVTSLPPASFFPLGNALGFNGNNQYVSVTNFGSLLPGGTSEITVEFWAYTIVAGSQSAFMMNPDNSANRFQAHINYNDTGGAGNIYWDFGNISGNGRLGPSPAPANSIGNWVHYALVASSSNNYMRIYTNGILAANKTGTSSFTAGTSELRIGGPGFSYNGRLDEFRIWKTARSQSEIQTNLGTPLSGNETNLAVYYRFDNASGTIATNSAATGPAYNGVLVNGPVWVNSAAANTLVTTTVDSVPGSLRQAITNALPNTTITFAQNLSGSTITLTNGQLELPKNITIDGTALSGGIAINGNQSNRVFYVNSGVTATLNTLTITNGFADFGGGIFVNSGTLTASNCTFVKNSATGNGGAIDTFAATVNVSGCTFATNSTVFSGGALDNYLGPMTVSQCTFVGNSAGGGGGIYNWTNSSLTVNQSTVTGNSASTGGGINNAGGTASLNNSIVVANTATSGANLSGSFTGANNVTSGPPQLTPFANYGGPTKTMLPLPGSPAIDGGSPTVFTTDQRGLPRVVGPLPDIGAVEANWPATNIVINTLADSGTGSLRDIIAHYPAGSTITFSTNLSGSTLLLTSGEILLNKNMTIDASALPNGITLDGNGSNRVFIVVSSTNVLTALTITNGNNSVDGAGGGVFNYFGNLTMNRCTVVGNNASNGNLPTYAGGGGVFNYGTLTLNQCTIARNTAQQGGGIGTSLGGIVNLNHSTVVSNTATTAYGGGGISVETSGGPSVLINSNSIVAGNNATSDLNIAGAATSVGTNLTSGNPLLAPLGNYGGPTPTMPPLPGSPAINAAAATGFVTDQRGFTRVFSGAPDIGAVEVQTGTLNVTIALNGLGSGVQINLSRADGFSTNYLTGANGVLSVPLPLDPYLPYTLTPSVPGAPGVGFSPAQVTTTGSNVVNFSVLNSSLVVGGRVTGGTNPVAGITMQLLHIPVTTNVALSIPDLGGGSITSSIVIPYGGTIGLVRVGVDISHSFRGDLALTLISPPPANTSIRLKVSDVNDDYFDVDTSYPNLEATVDSLTNLNGQSMTGTWRLKIEDQYAQDIGVLNSWSLMFGPATTNTDVNGYYAFNGLPGDNYFVQPIRPDYTFLPESRANVPVGTTNANFNVGTTVLRGVVRSGGVGFPGVPVVVGTITNLTDASGFFVFTELLPTNYTIVPTLAGYGFSPSFITTNGGSTNLVFNATNFPISGRILDTKANGVGGVTMTAGTNTTLTADDGSYMIPNLPSATYVVTPTATATLFNPTNRAVTLSTRGSNNVDFLVLQSPPAITPIADRVIRRFESTGPIRFDISDRETRGSLLRIEVTSSDSAIFAPTNLVLAGESNFRTIAITNASGVVGVATIMLSVTDGTATTALSFIVRVDSVPEVGIGSALNFNGTNSHLVVTNSIIGNKGDYSVEAWVNVPTNTAGPRTILAQGGANTANGFFFGFDALGKIRAGSGWTNTGVPFPFGGWHHLAVVKDNTNALLYVDGVLATNRNITLPLPPQIGRFDIGSQVGGTNEFWLGGLEDVRVWKTARTAADIADGKTRRFTGAEEGLLGLWHFDEATNSIARDSTSRSNHAAVIAATWIESGVVFDHYTVQEESVIMDVLSAFDADGDALSFRLVNPPIKGAVTLLDTNTGAFRYTAFTNVNGTDSFSFQASDGSEDSEIGFVTVNILADTNPPSFITVFTNLVMAEDTTTNVNFTIGDRESQAALLTVSAYSSQENIVPGTNIIFGGSLSNRTMTIVPVTNGFGTNISISVVVNDGQQKATNLFLLTVFNVNDAPTLTTLTNQLIARGTNTPAQPFTLADVDDSITNLVIAKISSNPQLIANANISISTTGATRTVTMTPTPGVSGAALITLVVGDPAGATNATSFVVTVDNPPTLVSSINPQTGFRNNATHPIKFTLQDTEVPVATNLTVTARSSDQEILPDAKIVIQGTGTNRSIVATPKPGKYGVVTVTLTVSDGLNIITTSFQLEFLSGPLYEIVDLGEYSSPFDINDSSQILMRAPTFILNPLGSYFIYKDGLQTFIPFLPGGFGFLYTINNSGVVGGYGKLTNGGPDRALIYTNNAFVALDNTNSSPAQGYAFRLIDLNDRGDYLLRNVASNAFSYSRGTNYYVLQNNFTSARDLNNSGDIVGTVNGGEAAILRASGSVQTFGQIQGSISTSALKVNNRGQILIGAGNSDTNFNPFSTWFLLSGSITNRITAGVFDDGGVSLENSLAGLSDLNDAGQVVGQGAMTNSAIEFGYKSVAVVWSDGFTYDLYDQLLNTNDWVSLDGADAINNKGEIVGYGYQTDGTWHGYLLKPQWIIGEPLSPPLAAFKPGLTNGVFFPPNIEILASAVGDNALNSFVWSDVDNKLYPVRPVTARISWYTTGDLTTVSNNPSITMVGTANWPDVPQQHIVNAPVQLEPVNASSPWHYFAYSYPSEGGGVTVDSNFKIFQRDRAGYSVVRYLNSGQQTPNPAVHSNYFQVVRSFEWNDPAVLKTASIDVGQRATEPVSGTNAPPVPSQKSGWVVFDKAYYDGAGGERAYDRATQTGPIIPVNARTVGDPTPDLAVVFYHTNRIGVDWAQTPVLYSVQWPTNSEQIVIASGNGSGPLSPVLYPQKRIYNQPDKTLPGYNPNEEHAFFAPTSTGEGLFALRNDLNVVSAASPAFSLLKYRDPADGKWAMKVFQITLTNAEYPEFRFSGTAGNEIQPPYPLSLLPLCPSTAPFSGQYWRDKNNKIYAKAGPTPEDPNAEIVVRYHYPLQTGFWFDLDLNGTNDLSLGVCVPWMDRQTSIPIDTTYKIHWPSEAPGLQIGETLTTAKVGLPDIKNFASAQIVFDPFNPDGNHPLQSKVRLFDPYSARVLRFSDYSSPNGRYRLVDGSQLPAGYVLPTTIKRTSQAGKDSFVDLPFHLRKRLKFDPINKWLSFEGLDVDTGTGDPLVLINVMSAQERDDIKKISANADFQKIVDALYDLTRNPNRIDQNRDGVADRELLIGYNYEYAVRVPVSLNPPLFATNYTSIRPEEANMVVLTTNIVTERFTGTSKALTAGLPFDPPMPAPGYAWQFDGVSSSIAINRPMQPVKDFTIEFWLRTSQTAGSVNPNWNPWTSGMGLVDASRTDGTPDFGITLLNGNVLFGVGSGGGLGAQLLESDFTLGVGDFIKKFEDARGRGPIENYLLSKFAPDLQLMLRKPTVGVDVLAYATAYSIYGIRSLSCCGGNVTRPVITDFLSQLTAAMYGPNAGSFYQAGPFAGVSLSPETQALIAAGSGANFGRRNRLLLEDAYRSEILRTYRDATLSGTFVADGSWHHVAATRKVVDSSHSELTLLVDGQVVATNKNTSINNLNNASQWMFGKLLKGGNHYQGLMDEVRVWSKALTPSEIKTNYSNPVPLTGSEAGLVGDWLFDEGQQVASTRNAAQSGSNPGLLSNIVAAVPVTNSVVGLSGRYITIAENNDPALAGLPVRLHVIRLDGGPVIGDMRVLFPDNVFDERLTLRLSPDFGGAPENLTFEWWTHPDSAVFDPKDLPLYDANGNVTNAQGWVLYKPPTAGRNFITIGGGDESSLFTLSDNWFIARYRGYNVAGNTNWTGWIGDPSFKNPAAAQLAPGWVKRVIEGINPYDQRVKDFHNSPVATYSSMLQQAGQRYEGPIALNPDPASINSVGLIQIYSTVLDRGRSLSIDGTPAVDSDPANNSLLLAASRIADLYMLIGNEAAADALDPTIGITVFSPEFSAEFSSRASAIFAFQNQLDTLLEEELCMLRGRDTTHGGVQGSPAYNRLKWNFTGGDGEVAYFHNYNLSDLTLDGTINEFDAKIQFPQGHGDAWGHYLTAATTYYDLLRHPKFTWVPRTEKVLLAGSPVEVDFLDERKFARVASAKARTGREIVDLTYRQNYVEDPEGQYQGYKDTDASRAWGVTEWARRGGQGAYFDWLTANAILPSKDPNTNHVGIQKIDRTTVNEIGEIVSHHNEIQALLDKADGGLNPVGLAKGAVPFDIDPGGSSQFDQILDRAKTALRNTQQVWNDVNSLTRSLRRRQDATEEFTRNAIDQERDFKNRLIEIFGYPYAGDIGPGAIYPSGYDGPDLYHWMYVAATEVGQSVPATPYQTILANYKALASTGVYFPNDLPGVVTNLSLNNPNQLQVSYPLTASDFGFMAPTSYGQRRAPGEIQMALSDLVQAQARLKQSLVEYDNHVNTIQLHVNLLNTRHGVNASVIRVLTDQKQKVTDMNISIGVMRGTQIALRRVSSMINAVSEITVESLPKVLGLASDALAPVRGGVKLSTFIGENIIDWAADGLEIAENSVALAKEVVPLQTEIEVTTENQKLEVQQAILELKVLMQDEPAKRLEAYNQAEVVRQMAGRVQAALASGQRLIQERLVFRTYTASDTQENRYQDMAFRIFRNDALQKYRAQFDLAARYVYLAANAYDYEVNLLGSDSQAGRDFFTDIVRQRTLGQIVDGEPVVGQPGLADVIGRLDANWDVLKNQFGIVNPQVVDARFSLRRERFRIKYDETGINPAVTNALSDLVWQTELTNSIVPDLWKIPQFRRYCRPFAPESAGPQPGIVIRFSSTITFGLNYFGWPLSGGDSAYDPTQFSTKIARAGVWLKNQNPNALSATPRVYLVPVGMDIMRSPTGDTLATREFRIMDQVIPEPFPIGASSLSRADWIPINDSLGGNFAQIRRYASFPALQSATYDAGDLSQDNRLIGRSAWNTEWMLIIPGGTLLSDPNEGIKAFIQNVKDIKFYFQTYSYSGN